MSGKKGTLNQDAKGAKFEGPVHPGRSVPRMIPIVEEVWLFNALNRSRRRESHKSAAEVCLPGVR